MSHFFAGNMKKMKGKDLKGMQIHNQRERESESNTSIDKQRSKLNYDLANEEPIDYNEKVKRRLEEGLKKGARVRKDSVMVNSWVITSDYGFFKRIGEKEEKRFFEETYKWFCDRYGKENIAYAQVHKDEKTPHMHIGVIPITKDGRLSSKELFNRVRLKEVQDRFPKYIQEKGFDLKRGIPGKEKHVEPVKWKNRQVIEQYQELGKALEKRLLAVKAVQMTDRWVDGIKYKEKGFWKKDKVIISKEDFGYLKEQAKRTIFYKSELSNMKGRMTFLEDRNKMLEQDREKARKYDRLGDLLGREKIEKALEMQQEKELTREKTKGLGLEP